MDYNQKRSGEVIDESFDPGSGKYGDKVKHWFSMEL